MSKFKEVLQYWTIFWNCHPKTEIVNYILERFYGNHIKFSQDVYVYKNGCKFNCGKVMENIKVIFDISDKMEIECEQGKVFIDVGSHIGKHSIPIAKQGHKVIAIEPTKDSFDLLCDNIRLNHTTNVLPYNVACSNKFGLMSFNYDQMYPATNSMVHKKPKTTNVKCIPLDYFKKYPIGAIKIDVEGHELEVLKGSTEILKKYHPTIYFEAWTIEEAHIIETFLNDFGYSNMKQIDKFNYVVKK